MKAILVNDDQYDIIMSALVLLAEDYEQEIAVDPRGAVMSDREFRDITARRLRPPRRRRAGGWAGHEGGAIR